MEKHKIGLQWSKEEYAYEINMVARIILEGMQEINERMEDLGKYMTSEVKNINGCRIAIKEYMKEFLEDGTKK